jgi:Zn-dependent peptidase ImmA (M78 family)
MANKDKMTTISSDRLRYAREYYGLDIAQVAKKISSLKPNDIQSYEEGDDFPTYSKLEMLAKLYNRPMLYFFFKSYPQQERLTVAFRSMENEIGQYFDMQMRLMVEQAELYRLNIAELFHEQEYPKFSLLMEGEKVNNDSKLIEWLRLKLDLSLEKQKKFARAEILLEYLRDKLYEIGVYVFKDSFKTNDVSGLCLYDDDFPIILLNNKTTFTRQIFTIFHEAYHLYRKETDVYLPKLSEEKACDKFASEFLIPDEDLSKSVDGVNTFEDIEFIKGLANEYNVSPSSVAYRLKTRGLISPYFYGSIHDDGIRRMSAESSGGNYYYTRMSYLGKQYLKRIFTDYYAGKINTAAVGKYTGMKAANISKLSSYMYGGEF